MSDQISPPDLAAKVAAELDQIWHDLEDIGVSLCSDQAMAQQNITQLQRLDELGQRSRWLARLISAKDPQRLISEITLHSLAVRLRA
jgi:hypothetical protein